MAGLAQVATKRVGGFSLGDPRGQRHHHGARRRGRLQLAAAAAARHPQLDHPGLGADHRQLPTLPASSALLTTGAADETGAYLSTQAGLIVIAAHALVPIAAAAVTLHRRDA